MKLQIFSICFILVIACSSIVQAHHQDCACSGLGQGSNPCSCSEVVVKAAKLPKPTQYVSPQQIKDSAAARSSMVISGSSQGGCSNSQSSSRSQTTTYSNGNSNDNSNNTPYTNINSNSNPTSYSSTSSNANSNAQTETTVMYTDTSSSSSSESAVVYTAEVSYSDESNEGKSDCNCATRQNVETLDNSDDTPSGNVVPRFPPVGDLCYPLPVEPRSGKLKEKPAKVTPAYPGKVVCCNPSVPYEVCINTMTGETKSRALTSSTSDVTTFTSSSGNTYAVVKSDIGVYNLAPMPYASKGNKQKQYSRITMSSTDPDCFGDTTGESQTDSYPAVPADAVSLTLAYKNLRAPNVIYRQGKQFVPEDKLSFGHRTLPTDAKNEKKTPDIAEEKLVTVNKPVVELKLAPPKSVVVGSYDEQEEAKLAELEAIERESITQEESVDQIADSLITYKDLGYAPISGRTLAKFKSYDEGTITNRDLTDSAEEPCGPLGAPISGYVPGKVIVQQQMVADSSEEVSESLETHHSGSKSCPT